MTTGDDKKRQARKDFVFGRQSIPTIALSLGVSESTVRRWKRDAKATGNDWDIARSSAMVAGEGMEAAVSNLIEEFVVQFQVALEQTKTEEGIPAGERVKLLTSLGDAFNKMVSSAGRVAPKISELGVAHDVLQRLAEFIAAEYPQHSDAFLEVLEPFGERLVEAYS